MFPVASSRGKFPVCRSGRHPLSKSNLSISKDGKRRCVACWWERKLDFIAAFNRSKTNGVTSASVYQLLEWSEKAQRVGKMAEAAVDAATRSAQKQDLKLFWAIRKCQEAQRRLEKIVQTAREISDAQKLKASKSN